MPDLKYLYRVLYIAFLNKLLIFFLTKLTKGSCILIIEHSSVVTVAKWLDGSFKSQSRWFDHRQLDPGFFLLIKISYLECMFNFRDPGMFYYYFMPY